MKKRILSIFCCGVIIGTASLSWAASQSLSVEEIVSKNADAIVLVGALTAKGTSFGSGFVVSRDGLIVTNYHVIHNALSVGIKLKNNKRYENVLLAYTDEQKDIAVLKVQKGNFAPVALGNSQNVKTGERVVAIGNPLGLERTVSDGLISAIRDAGKGLKVLQITAPVSEGSSGGPLFNMKGEVIGIAVGTNKDGQNINFAIPINYVKRLLDPDRNSRKDERPKASERSKNTRIYTVRSKDTLFSLSRRFNTSVEHLMKINGLTDANIFAGQALKVPKAP